MAVLRQSEASRVAERAIVLDLGDLKRQGQALREHAEAQVAAMLLQARQERDRLIAGAREEGRVQGLEQGRAEGLRAGAEQGRQAALAEHRAALEQLEKAWKGALEHFTRERDRMLLEARQDVLRLALCIAAKVTRRHADLDPGVVEAQLGEVLAQVARPTRLTVAVSAADEPVARAALPSLIAGMCNIEHVELVVDPSLSRGSCVARTPGGGVIDAAIETQLDRIVQALMPESAP